ncbi:N-acetyltransferase [Pseudorhodoferax sp. Leaf274]|uniref:GNAT family N-acetyltransferase n=1 Tax=Pseudorhodoferax sp. Leaf274 TaxID=1736318 RepID=UPI00070399F2|nr:N-acetyltransferase [Pseudorhodoferax sp. Leaf274]KQP49555.1 hypothetical protein ASF44_02880 [Pseudorhodoferax sp. Leaf274]
MPSYRGHGIGRGLVDAAIQHARARDGLRTLTLTITARNVAAIALYRAAGFAAFGSEPLAVKKALAGEHGGPCPLRAPGLLRWPA